MLNTNTIVTCDPHLVIELFEKRAINYSDREINTMAILCDWDKDILFLSYGQKLKLYRTMLNRALNNRVALDYIPLQEDEVRKFMKHLVDEPEGFMGHVRLMREKPTPSLAASIAIRLAYGYKVASYDDPLVQTAEKHMEGFSDTTQPWNWVVNMVPALRYLPDWLPILPFQRRAKEIRGIFAAHRDRPFQFAQEQIASGIAEDSFTAKLLRTEDGEPVDEDTKEHIKCIASTFYAAGSDTTVSVVQSFFLAMALYPEIQAKAKAEMQAYTEHKWARDGTRSMIVPADRPNLPYTSALVREILRWHPIVPLVGHRSSDQDDNSVVVEGKTYRIPARCHVLSNVWQILHDPEVYEDPDRFMPERFLVENPPPDPENYAFGFGRRSCPGMHIAQQSMWISISNLLANFTITKSKDANGQDIIPQELYTNGTVSHPKPFVCTITPDDGCKEWLQGMES
ncbi:cytochrome P450 family protein [Ceratobasidium sp. AG-Ba]|nr:cytochrome P450 family protein [Ceratobasidium sp. AG-Ba]